MYEVLNEVKPLLNALIKGNATKTVNSVRNVNVQMEMKK